MSADSFWLKNNLFVTYSCPAELFEDKDTLKAFQFLTQFYNFPVLKT